MTIYYKTEMQILPVQCDHCEMSREDEIDGLDGKHLVCPAFGCINYGQRRPFDCPLVAGVIDAGNLPPIGNALFGTPPEGHNYRGMDNQGENNE
jgi:hypothetical protein